MAQQDRNHIVLIQAPAGGCFYLPARQAGFDPGSDGRLLRLRKAPLPVGRHRTTLDQLVELALRRPSGHHHRTRFAPFQHTGEAAEIQLLHHQLLPMATQAVFLEDGEDLLPEGFLRGRARQFSAAGLSGNGPGQEGPAEQAQAQETARCPCRPVSGCLGRKKFHG